MPTMSDLIWAAAFADATARSYGHGGREHERVDTAVEAANRAVRDYEYALRYRSGVRVVGAPTPDADAIMATLDALEARVGNEGEST